MASGIVGDRLREVDVPAAETLWHDPDSLRQKLNPACTDIFKLEATKWKKLMAAKGAYRA